MISNSPSRMIFLLSKEICERATPDRVASRSIRNYLSPTIYGRASMAEHLITDRPPSGCLLNWPPSYEGKSCSASF